MSNPAFDNKIDDEVDRVLERMDTDRPEDFAKRIQGLSKVSRLGLIAMVKEQIAVEGDPDRKAKLQELEQHLNR